MDKNQDDVAMKRWGYILVWCKVKGLDTLQNKMEF